MNWNFTSIPFCLSAVVLLVRSHAVNDVAWGGAAVLERLAVEWVARDLTDPLWCEHVEALRKASVLPTVLLQSKAHRGRPAVSRVYGDLLEDLAERREQQPRHGERPRLSFAIVPGPRDFPGDRIRELKPCRAGNIDRANIRVCVICAPNTGGQTQRWIHARTRRVTASMDSKSR